MFTRFHSLSSKVQGPSFALISAALFGVSPVLVKWQIGDLPPIFIAGLLYLGSAIGLGIFRSCKKTQSILELRSLTQKQRLKLLGSILAGGILAPVCLVYGIREATAFEASIMLNLESVATTLIAWIFFHENIGPQVWIGKGLVLLGGGILMLTSLTTPSFSFAGLLLLGASVLWGIDNNLTRDLETLSPSLLTTLKGWVAGGLNCALAYHLGQALGGWNQIARCLLIGAFSYGLSLILFIEALRTLGSSRTSTYFAIGPFFGMIFALFFLEESPQAHEWVSAALMLAGMLILYFEHHEHLHTHTQMTHSHRHIHDEHHQHAHNGTEGSEPHDHFHIHEELTHTHAHLPDIHHRHRH